MRVIYISHPYRADPVGNVSRVRILAREMALRGGLPLAPQLILPSFLSEEAERHLALQMCLKLVALADELRAFGPPTEGMLMEIAEARRLGISVVYKELS